MKKLIARISYYFQFNYHSHITISHVYYTFNILYYWYGTMLMATIYQYETPILDQNHVELWILTSSVIWKEPRTTIITHFYNSVIHYGKKLILKSRFQNNLQIASDIDGKKHEGILVVWAVLSHHYLLKQFPFDESFEQDRFSMSIYAAKPCTWKVPLFWLQPSFMSNYACKLFLPADAL